MEREGYIIYYDPYIGGHTLDEWLICWSWQYFINHVSTEEYLEKIDYVTVDMPGVFDSERWDCHTKYLETLRLQSLRL